MARDARKTENLPAGDNTTPMSPVISYAMQIGGERTKTHTRSRRFIQFAKSNDHQFPLSEAHGMASLDRPTKC